MKINQQLKKLKGILKPGAGVILIEDFSFLVAAQKDFFENNFKVEIIAPKNYSEAKELLKNKSYKLVILDLNLSSWKDVEGNTGVNLIPYIAKKTFTLCSSTETESVNILIKEKRIDLGWSKDQFFELKQSLNALE